MPAEKRKTSLETKETVEEDETAEQTGPPFFISKEKRKGRRKIQRANFNLYT